MEDLATLITALYELMPHRVPKFVSWQTHLMQDIHDKIHLIGDEWQRLIKEMQPKKQSSGDIVVWKTLEKLHNTVRVNANLLDLAIKMANENVETLNISAPRLPQETMQAISSETVGVYNMVKDQTFDPPPTLLGVMCALLYHVSTAELTNEAIEKTKSVVDNMLEMTERFQIPGTSDAIVEFVRGMMDVYLLPLTQTKELVQARAQGIAQPVSVDTAHLSSQIAEVKSLLKQVEYY